MNFNNGYPSFSSPYGYGTPYNRPYGQPYPQQPQPTQPYVNQVPQQNYEIPIQQTLFVTSKEAEAHIVMPNTKVLLIDRTSGIAYLKYANNMGESQTQYFKFQPVDANGAPIGVPEDKVEISFENYITKDELNAMGFAKAEDVKLLTEKIDNLQKMVGSKNAK